MSRQSGGSTDKSEHATKKGSVAGERPTRGEGRVSSTTVLTMGSCVRDRQAIITSTDGTTVSNRTRGSHGRRAVCSFYRVYTARAAAVTGRRRKPIIQCHYTHTHTHIRIFRTGFVRATVAQWTRPPLMVAMHNAYTIEYCNARKTPCRRTVSSGSGSRRLTHMHTTYRRAYFCVIPRKEKDTRHFMYVSRLSSSRLPTCIIRVSIVRCPCTPSSCPPNPTPSSDAVRILTGTHVLEKYPNRRREGLPSSTRVGNG